MLHVEKGKIKVEGNIVEIMTDISVAIKTISQKNILSKEDIQKCVQLGLMSDDEFEKEYNKKKMDLVKKLLGIESEE